MLKLVSLLLIGFSQITFAKSTAYPCFRFGYSEKIAVDSKTLPAGVKITKKISIYEGHFLVNQSAKPLVIKLDNSNFVKLASGKHFEAQYEGTAPVPPEEAWKLESSEQRIIGNTNFEHFIKGKAIPDIHLYGSNESAPVKPKGVNFNIQAIFDGAPALIKGILSYEVRERKCK